MTSRWGRLALASENHYRVFGSSGGRKPGQGCQLAQNVPKLGKVGVFQRPLGTEKSCLYVVTGEFHCEVLRSGWGILERAYAVVCAFAHQFGAKLLWRPGSPEPGKETTRAFPSFLVTVSSSSPVTYTWGAIRRKTERQIRSGLTSFFTAHYMEKLNISNF